MGKDCLREEQIGGSSMEARRRYFQVELKANLNVQILKNVFIPMSKVTYQNNIILIVYYFSRLSPLSSALAILYHL